MKSTKGSRGPPWLRINFFGFFRPRPIDGGPGFPGADHGQRSEITGPEPNIALERG